MGQTPAFQMADTPTKESYGVPLIQSSEDLPFSKPEDYQVSSFFLYIENVLFND